MISGKTVFILGAGASVPYGYPTGFKLNQEIKTFLANFPESSQCSDEQNKVLSFFNKLGYEPRDLKKFEKSLLGSARYSIDKFLEKRDDCRELGKHLIAYILKKKENEHSLCCINLGEGNWYAELFNRLDTTVDNIDNQQISFLTFNYDRSLEFFLYNILKERTTKDNKTVLAAFSKVSIVHVYGSLDYYPWNNECGITYSYEFTPEDVSAMANCIHIMSEERETIELKKAHELLADANNIYILGFGYDEQNIDRLKIAQYGQGKKIVGTCIGLSWKRQREIQRYMSISPESRNTKTKVITDCNIVFCKGEESIMDLVREYIEFT